MLCRRLRQALRQIPCCLRQMRMRLRGRSDSCLIRSRPGRCSCFQYVMLRSTPDTLTRFSLVLVGCYYVLLDRCFIVVWNPGFVEAGPEIGKRDTQKTKQRPMNGVRSEGRIDNAFVAPQQKAVGKTRAAKRYLVDTGGHASRERSRNPAVGAPSASFCFVQSRRRVCQQLKRPNLGQGPL